MRAMKLWDSLLRPLKSLWELLLDNLTAVGAFVIIGLAALVVHKSVEIFHSLGVPSNLIAGMRLLDTCMWDIDALSVLWLCGTLTYKFCIKVVRGEL
jgi:hypothetical protein